MTISLADAVQVADSFEGRLLVEAVIPFVDAALFVLESECHEHPRRGVLSKTSTAVTPGDVSAVVPVLGRRVAGAVIYSMTLTTANQLASVMLGQVVTHLDSLASSALAELANVITGQATTQLQKSGFPSELAPPDFIVGSGRHLFSRPITCITVPLHTLAGPFLVHIALRQCA